MLFGCQRLIYFERAFIQLFKTVEILDALVADQSVGVEEPAALSDVNRIRAYPCLRQTQILANRLWGRDRSALPNVEVFAVRRSFHI